MKRIKDYLIIGRIVKPFGIRGEVKLIPITDDVTRFKELNFVYLRRGSEYQKVLVEEIRYTNNFVLLKLEQLSSRDEAEELRGSYIYTDREHAAAIDKNSYYYYDILGCTVRTTQEEVLGKVVDIQNAGSCDVYCVRIQDTSDKEVLIPAVQDVIKRIDIEQREIIIEAIDGLL